MIRYDGMANELKVRSFRIEDDVWEAVRAHELSANQLLKMALSESGISEAARANAQENSGNGKPGASLGGQPKAGLSDGLSNQGSRPDVGLRQRRIESWRRGPRQKGDKGR